MREKKQTRAEQLKSIVGCSTEHAIEMISDSMLGSRAPNGNIIKNSHVVVAAFNRLMLLDGNVADTVHCRTFNEDACPVNTHKFFDELRYQYNKHVGDLTEAPRWFLRILRYSAKPAWWKYSDSSDDQDGTVVEDV